MASTTRVVGVEDLGEVESGRSGVVSCQIIPYDQLSDEDLEMLFEQSPDWVMEKRPDWIQKHYPNKVN